METVPALTVPDLVQADVPVGGRVLVVSDLLLTKVAVSYTHLTLPTICSV